MMNYQVRALGINLTPDKNRRVHYDFFPSNAIRGTWMTSSIEDILFKVFDNDDNAFNKFLELYKERCGKYNSLENITLDNDERSLWNGRSICYIGDAGSGEIPSIGRRKDNFHEVTIKNPPHNPSFDRWSDFYVNCSCPRFRNATVNHEGDIGYEICHHLEAYFRIISEGIRRDIINIELEYPKGTKIDKVPIPLILNKIYNLDNMLHKTFAFLFTSKTDNGRFYSIKFIDEILLDNGFHTFGMDYYSEFYNKNKRPSSDYVDTWFKRYGESAVRVALELSDLAEDDTSRISIQPRISQIRPRTVA